MVLGSVAWEVVRVAFWGAAIANRLAGALRWRPAPDAPPPGSEPARTDEAAPKRLADVLRDGWAGTSPFSWALDAFVRQEGDQEGLQRCLIEVVGKGEFRVGIRLLESLGGDSLARALWVWLLCVHRMESQKAIASVSDWLSVAALARSMGVGEFDILGCLSRSNLERLGVRRAGPSETWKVGAAAQVSRVPHAATLLATARRPRVLAVSCSGVVARFPMEKSSREALVAFMETGHGLDHWTMAIIGQTGGGQLELARKIFETLGWPFVESREVKPEGVPPGVGWLLSVDSTYGHGSIWEAVENRVGPTIVVVSEIPDAHEKGQGPGDAHRGNAGIVLRMANPGSDDFNEWIMLESERCGVDLSADVVRSLPLLSTQNVLGLLQVSKQDARPGHAEGNLEGAGHRADSSAFVRMAKAFSPSRSEFERLTWSITPKVTLADLVVDDATREALEEVCGHILSSDEVLDDWGLRGRLVKDSTRSFLFHGPSGTGKSMAAEAVAMEVGLPLRAVDASQIHGRYYGETESALREIFWGSETNGGRQVLLFDEAEGFLMNRQGGVDTESTWERQWVNQVLTHMEHYKGVMIFTTNLPEDLDAAFLRRMALRVAFKAPDKAQRLGIWRALWSDKIPLAGTVDLEALAGEFAMSGGLIKQAFVSACVRARSRGCLSQEMLVRACQQAMASGQGKRMGFHDRLTRGR